MMDMPIVEIVCPLCSRTIKIPFFRELEAKAIEDYDMAEVSAQLELDGLRSWLYHQTLWGLIGYWWRRKDGGVSDI